MLERSSTSFSNKKQVTVLSPPCFSGRFHVVKAKRTTREGDTPRALSKSKLPAENMTTAETGKREHQLSSKQRTETKRARAHAQAQKRTH